MLKIMRELICGGLCRYYKPEKSEENGCAGWLLLKDRFELSRALVELAPRDSDMLFGLSDDDPRLWKICRTCEYRPDGCDFRDDQVARDQCAPCGGLRALAGILAAGIELGL